MASLTRTSLVAALALSTACATFEAPSAPRVIDARLNVGNMGTRNAFELRNQPSEPRQTDAKPRRPVTPILYWLGIGMLAVGGATAIGTGAAGYATKRQLKNGYDGSLTAEDTRTLETRGEGLNKAMIAGAVVGIIGAALAITTFGIDYTRCGPVAPKRRRQNAPPGRCATEDSK